MRILCLIIIFALTPAIFIIAVDPYEVWHDSYINKNMISENERFRNAGIIRREILSKNKPKATVLVGTSMSQNIYVEDIEKQFNSENAVRLVTSGAYPIEQFAQINYALSTGNVKTIIWEVYRNWVSPNFNRPNSNYSFPFYIYDRKPWNDYPLAFNHTMLLSSFDKIYGDKKLGKFGWSNDRNSVSALHPRALKEGKYLDWISPKNQARINRLGKEIITAGENYNLSFTSPTPKVLSEYVKPLIEKHPEVNFIFFTPPVSTIRQLEDFQKGVLETKFKLERDLNDLSKSHGNVQLISLGRSFDITNDMTNYKDSGHFDRQTSLWVLDKMANSTPSKKNNIQLHGDQKIFLEQLLKIPPKWPSNREHAREILIRTADRDRLTVGNENDILKYIGKNKSTRELNFQFYFIDENIYFSRIRKELSKELDRYIIVYIPGTNNNEEFTHTILTPEYYKKLRSEFLNIKGTTFEDNLKINNN
jgi:hypothetical protein